MFRVIQNIKLSKRPFGLSFLFAAALSMLALAAHPASARSGNLYQNGFEPGDPGTADFYDSTTGSQGFNIAVVANGGGQLGLTAPEGTHYAEITNTENAYQNPGYGQSVSTDYGYARNGGTYDPITGQPNSPGIASNGQPFYQSIKVYINTNWAAQAAPYGDAFWIDSTPYNDPGYNDETNFRVDVLGGGTVTVNAFVGNPGTNGNVANITTSGWYTFKTTYENTGGLVSNNMSVLDPSGNVVGSFDGVTTLPFAALTGTNYADWFTVWQNGFGATTGPNENGAADVLGIDDVEVGTLPEPASLGILGFTGLAALRRKRLA